MNLNNQPTVDQLAQLLAVRKDRNDSHILWVCEAGNVHVEALGPLSEETQFEQQRPAMCARLRTYRRGLGYVGKKAAADRHFVSQVLNTLTQAWQTRTSGSGIHVIDRYY
ncbi:MULTISPECIES: hypothetical protein [Pseudomonas]|uniref:Uncharacterized protein n=1 Tax=Pseudomonas quercus TaxID=2722792 RepID=A0ABX0Y939_9PSED|nr:MULTISPECIES: hypothetical protein [Pseudomonas]MBF7141300.1 hypothetical protein [Pseudomonas sp. LY10J]NJO99833.1 hypothetical protein [Pseudomonas quercus]